MQEVEANRPAYAVVVDVWDSWLQRPGSPQVVAFNIWMNRYVSDGFDEVGMVELADQESRYVWGDEARGIISRAARSAFSRERAKTIAWEHNCDRLFHRHRLS